MGYEFVRKKGEENYQWVPRVGEIYHIGEIDNPHLGKELGESHKLDAWYFGTIQGDQLYPLDLLDREFEERPGVWYHTFFREYDGEIHMYICSFETHVAFSDLINFTPPNSVEFAYAGELSDGLVKDYIVNNILKFSKKKEINRMQQ